MVQAVASCGCGCIAWSYQSNPSVTLALQVRLLVLTSEQSIGGSLMNMMVVLPPRFGAGTGSSDSGLGPVAGPVAGLWAAARRGASSRPPVAPNVAANKARRVGRRLSWLMP